MRGWMVAASVCGMMGWSAGASAQPKQCACPDGMLRQGAQAEAAAEQVFWGKLVAFEEETEGTWRATFEPERGYKGIEVKKGAEVDIMTPAPDLPCSAQLKLRKKFMVFATREAGKLVTSLCHGTEQAAAAPIAPGVTSILPTPPGPGPLESRVARAEDVVVVEAVSVGKPFAGGWHNVTAKFKVKKSYKGGLKGTFTARFDERSCGGKKHSLIAQLDEDGQADEAPAEEGGRYLMFTYGEQPPYVMLCHENFVAVEGDDEAVRALDRLCKGNTCKQATTGAAAAAKVRREVRGALESAMRGTLATCRKRAPFKVGDGVITDITLEVQVLPDGKPRVTNLQANGTIEDSAAYDALNTCLTAQIDAWSLPAFPGDSVRAAWSIFMDDKGAPKDVIFELGAVVYD